MAIGQDENGNLLVASRLAKSIARFAPAASGNVSPDAVIGGADTTLGFPAGVDVDTQARIYVSNQFNNTIAISPPMPPATRRPWA